MQNNKTNFKAEAIFSFYAMILGIFVGTFVWSFLKILSYATLFLWDYIPSKLNIPFFTILICTTGGIIIGLFRLKFGPYPELLEDVISKVKKEKHYRYDNIMIVTVAALLPLIFGGSIGPEAGMTGIIVGLCYWVGDRLKLAGETLSEFTSIGISAGLGVLFSAPLFGISEYAENPSDENSEIIFSKPAKLFAKIFAIIGGIGIYYVLGQFLGNAMSLPRIGAETVSNYDRILGIPTIVIGILFGYIYLIFNKICIILFKKLSAKKWLSFIGTVLGGIILGIIGTLFPLTMFSGEEQMSTLLLSYRTYAPIFLIAIGVIKLFITNFCIYSGWRGGHFFPVIFSGVSIGYGIALLLHTTPSLTIAIITATILATVMRKPLTVTMLLLLCLPFRTIPWMIIAAFIAGNIPLPKFLRSNNKK